MTLTQGPIAYCHDDTNEWETVHTVKVPVFYQQVHGLLKGRIMDCITQASAAMQEGDKMIIVVSAHGDICTRNILINFNQDKESLGVEECYLVLKQLPTDVSFIFVNLLYFSG